MMRTATLVSTLLLALGAVASSCSSSDTGTGVTCGNVRCPAGEQCCDLCGSQVCGGSCPAVECTGEAGGAPCGNTVCSLAEVCCTDCNGQSSCGSGCPKIACPVDGGGDAGADASDASGDSAGEGGSD